jgi:TnpA family transposase
VTQATIVRKLSSYARQNQTKKALWELDNIRRTIHILDFIDDPVLRQSVQKALNRGEAYHRMRRAISYVNSGKFRVKTEAEQQIWNECSRLIANAIIYYNTLLLSRVYEQKLAADDQEAIKKKFTHFLGVLGVFAVEIEMNQRVHRIRLSGTTRSGTRRSCRCGPRPTPPR